MRYFAVIDTNVLVSAILSKHEDAATVMVLKKIILDEITPLYDAGIVAEYEDVLHREKFNFSSAIVNRLIYTIKAIGIDSPRVHSKKQFIDENDRMFYEVYLSNPDAYLVTGNKRHFPDETRIVTPADIISIITKRSSA